MAINGDGLETSCLPIRLRELYDDTLPHIGRTY
jgi:hypothetical protein